MGIITSSSTGNCFNGTEDRSIVFQHPPQRHSAATSNSDDITAHPPFSLELGLTDEIRPVVEDWLNRLCLESANLKNFQRHRVRRIVLAMGDASLIADAFRRLNLFLHNADEVKHWLALLGLSALDVVEHSILSRPDYMRRYTVEMVAAFANKADSPEAAQVIFRISRRAELAQPAREWLETHPRETIFGLVEMVTNDDPLAEEAIPLLLMFKGNGHAEILAEALQTASAEVACRISGTKLPEPEDPLPIDEETTPDWLRQGLVYGTWNGKITENAVPAGLPEILIGGRHLNASQIRDFLTMLQRVSSPDKTKAPHGAFFEKLVQIIGKTRWEDFLWAVLENWGRKGFVENPQGLIFALGFWGDDFTVQKMNAKLRELRQVNTTTLHPAAMTLLRAIGTKTALSYIREYVVLPYSMGLSHGEAWSVYCSIAEDLKIPRHQLHELDLQTIPDCGFDTRGVRTFDFGPRKVLVTIDLNFRPVISNEYGKRKKRFPRPVRKDDSQKVKIAFREWELFNEQLRLVREVHLKQFETALQKRLTWRADSFTRHLIGNPAMIQYCRRIIWGTFTGTGSFLKSFRVCEDNTFSDQQDRPFIIPADCRIGIVHPTQMTYGEHHNWLQIFNDHFLPQPLPQLKS
jgi:hypothetical protein